MIPPASQPLEFKLKFNNLKFPEPVSQAGLGLVNEPLPFFSLSRLRLSGSGTGTQAAGRPGRGRRPATRLCLYRD
jgi:hypothetical protein